MVHAVALKLMCRTRFVSFRSVFRIRRVFGLMEIPRFNWHLMTSLFTRDRKEPKKAIHTHRVFSQRFCAYLVEGRRRRCCVYACVSSAILLYQFRIRHKKRRRELDEEKEETRDRDGEKEKKK